MLKRHSLGSSIAIAEGVSSAASIGSVWLLGKNEKLIEPVREFVAKHIVYPCEHCIEGSGSNGKPPPTKAELMEKSRERAGLLVKGAIMMGSEFAVHIPTQMAMEGRFDSKELLKVAKGKGLGMGATLVTLWLVDKASPGFLEKVEDKMKHMMGKPDCAPGKEGEACRSQGELCKLLVLDIPSSVMTGLVNYYFSRGRAH